LILKSVYPTNNLYGIPHVFIFQANCGAPLRIGKGQVFCNGKFNINQDLTTNTTTLIIKKNELMYGEWKCHHGIHIGSDSVDIKMPGKYWTT
jgi:hypothetical protein